MTLGFDYDQNAMTLVSMTQSGLSGSWYKATKAAWASADGDQDYNGVFLTLDFKIAETAKNGTYPVSILCSPGDICNSALEKLSFSLDPGSVTVTGAAAQPAPVSPSEPTTVTTPTVAPTQKPPVQSTEPQTTQIGTLPAGAVQSGISDTVVEELADPDTETKEKNTVDALSDEKAEKPADTETAGEPIQTAEIDGEKVDGAEETSETPEMKSHAGIAIVAAAVCVVGAAVILLKKKTDNK